MLYIGDIMYNSEITVSTWNFSKSIYVITYV